MSKRIKRLSGVMSMYFIAAFFIVCSFFETGAQSLVPWLIGVALIGFKLGCRAHEREMRKRMGRR